MLGGTIARLEAEAIRDALETYPSLTGAARALGMARDTLCDLMVRYHIAPEAHADRPFCHTFHAWQLVARREAPDGIRRVWRCQVCPAERKDGPS